MSWEITLITESISYQFENEEFQTQKISLISRDIHEEKSGGYNEPDDTVMIDKYEANSDHGLFVWTISARRSGFESQAYIDENEISVPEKCIPLELPKFKISS